MATEDANHKILEGINKVTKFIDRYAELGDAHMVDYFTKDHWNHLVASNVQKELLEYDLDKLCCLSNVLKVSSACGTCLENTAYSPQNIAKINNNAKDVPNGNCCIQDLKNFALQSKQCHLSYLNVFSTIEEIEAVGEKHKNHNNVSCDITSNGTVEIHSKEYMCQKKSHEVELMALVINMLCNIIGCRTVVDVGSGKGYLSTYLSLRYGINVTGIDFMHSICKGALQRAEKYENYWIKCLKNKIPHKAKSLHGLTSKFTHVTAQVKSDTQISDFLNSGDENVTKKCNDCVISGLHTCGDLCATALSLFAQQDCKVGMCVVGCCYHQLTEKVDDDHESQEIGFPLSNYLQEKRYKLGRTKRMLALKASERLDTMANSDQLRKSERSLFYRALLTVILVEQFGVERDDTNLHVGKVFAKSRDFADYVRKSLAKLRLDSTAIDDATIADYLRSYEPRFRELVAFTALRHLFAPAVEAAIVLDKLLFLRERDAVRASFLVRLFDPVKSPRCYAFVAWKM